MRRSADRPADADPLRPAGAVGAGLRALHMEVIKALTLPGTWWTAGLTAAGAVLLLLAALRAVPTGARPGFETLAWTWASFVQVGFLAGGVLTGLAEHASPQGRTTLLVAPGRWCVAAARGLVVVLGSAAGAMALVAVATTACPAGWTHDAAAAAARTAAWLVAVSIMSWGAAETLRSPAASLPVVLLAVVVAPVAARALGKAGVLLPGEAGHLLVAGPGGTGVERWQVWTVAAAWTLLACAVGTWRLTRTDA